MARDQVIGWARVEIPSAINFLNDCQERSVHPFVNVTCTCERKKRKTCLARHYSDICKSCSVAYPEESKHLSGQIILFSLGINHSLSKIRVSTEYHWFAASALHVCVYNLFPSLSLSLSEGGSLSLSLSLSKKRIPFWERGETLWEILSERALYKRDPLRERRKREGDMSSVI